MFRKVGRTNPRVPQYKLLLSSRPAANATTPDDPALALPPVRFERVWPPAESPSRPEGLTLWRPVPPAGFVALGHVCLLYTSDAADDTPC
eukprot:1184917-Prorocentrum_minimum.AAC.1